MKKLFLFLSLLASLSLEAQFVTTFAKNASESQSEGMMYYLPRNVIRLEFTIEETDSFIGPYAELASQLLGTNDYIKESKSEYVVKNIDIQTFTETDPSAVYYISQDEKSKEPMPNIIVSDNGVILAVGYDSIPQKYHVCNNTLIKNNLETIERVEVSFIEIPDSEVEIDDEEDDDEGGGNKKPRPITKEDKAKVALDKITNIRTAYFDLISGNQEIASGEIIKCMVEQMKNLENEYVSLFKGKTQRYTYKKVVYVTPESNQANASLSIAKFSKNEGFGDASGKGETVKIQFERQNLLENIDRMSEEAMNTAQVSKLFYRVPASSQVKILIGSNVIAESTLLVNQFGYIKVISAKNNKILFNPKTGQIISMLK